MDWLISNGAEVLLVLGILDRVLEEIPADTPVVGRYSGILRPIVKAVLRALGRKKG